MNVCDGNYGFEEVIDQLGYLRRKMPGAALF